MSISIGLVGLPNVGKSTLFNALTKNDVLAANYPFATTAPNVGIVAVPDNRLEKLAGLYRTKKIVPATVTFVDIAGLVKGASQGQGLGNQFLANIRQSHTIVQVVRAFHDVNVTHVEGEVDPKSDIETINTELLLADIQAIDRHLPKAENDAKKDSRNKARLDTLHKIRAVLDSGRPLSTTEPAILDLAHELQLLSAKPFIYVFNLDESDLKNRDLQKKLGSLVAPAKTVFLCAKTESELKELDAKDARELLLELGQSDSGLDQLIHFGYQTLGLQTFLTAGPAEVRAWTIHGRATAFEAAGVIHTDFQKGFIKAEIVSYEDLIEAGSFAAARSAGKARLEGKDYQMREGDVVEFRFNV